MSTDNDTTPDPFKKYPSVEYVRSRLRYEDGRLYWLHRGVEDSLKERHRSAWNSNFSGKEAGTFRTNKGYRRCLVNMQGNPIYRYKIIFAIHRGYWARIIDHIDRNSENDRIENLREATFSQNCGNAKLSPNNTSGFKGVGWSPKYQKWRAYIKVMYKIKHLGFFDTPESAHEAYMKAAKEAWGEFATGG